MRKIMICIIILTVIHNGAGAGLFKEDVEIADLSQLSPEALETLKDSEFKVFLMNVNVAGARVLENRAKEDLKTSKLTLNAKKSHVKTAEADLKEAKAAQDQARIDAAESTLRKAKESLEQAKLLIKWKEKEVDGQSAGVEKAKMALAVAEAERDLARISKLQEQNAPSAGKYSFSDFKARIEKKQKEYAKAVSNEIREIKEAKKLKEQYERTIKQ